METEIKGINDKIDSHTIDQKEDFKAINTKLDSLGAKLDTKYAGKWVEKLNIGILIAAIAGVTIFIIVN